MPLYFAYGSNMDAAAMRARCPRSRPLGAARLARHRFTIMGNGYASVVPDRAAEVHGVLFDLAPADVPALDRYEDVAHGLYVKRLGSVSRGGGGACRALIYYGTDPSEGTGSPPGYMEAVVAAARAVPLPPSHVATLERFLRLGAGAGAGQTAARASQW